MKCPCGRLLEDAKEAVIKGLVLVCMCSIFVADEPPEPVQKAFPIEMLRKAAMEETSVTSTTILSPHVRF